MTRIKHFDGSKFEHFLPGKLQENPTKLLLDLFPAKAAYSLFKIRENYNGPCLRIRRSNDNAETDIYFTGTKYIDETAMTTFTSTNSAYVTKWYDQSGFGYNVAQSTTANQPRIINAGTVDKRSGYIVVKFDGTNDNLQITSFLASADFVINTVANPVIGTLGAVPNIVAFASTANNTTSYISSLNNSSANVAKARTALYNTSYQEQLSTNTLAVNTRYTYSHKFYQVSSTNSDFYSYLTGSNTASTNTTITASLTNFAIGGLMRLSPSYATGEFEQVIVWDGVSKTNDELAYIEEYNSTLFGL